jgi:hypothetical protein
MGRNARAKVLREFDEKVVVGAYLQLARNALLGRKNISDVC